MKDIKDLKDGTKLFYIWGVLDKFNSISNVRVLSGAYGFRTNRLSAFIFTLTDEYGMKFSTEKLTTPKGDYIDFIYTLEKKPESAKDTLF